MLDYIYLDYIYYICRYTGLISIGVFFVCVIYMAVFGTNKFVGSFLIFTIIAFLFSIHDSRQRHSGNVPHYNCNGRIEWEAQYVDQALAHYFSVPDNIKIPSYSDLVKSGYYPLDKSDLKRRDILFKEAEFSIEIVGSESNEILIVLSCAEGKCPFGRWKCPRPSMGKYYVLRFEGGGVSQWVDRWEDLIL